MILIQSITTTVVGQVMNLNSYLDHLKENNIHLQQSNNRIYQAEKNRKMVRAALLPSVAAEAGYQQDFLRNYMFISETEGEDYLPDRFPMNFKHNFNAGVVADQALLNPIGAAEVKIAVLAEEHARLTHTDLTNELVKQATQLFWQALFAKESLEVMETNSELAQEQWNQMKDLLGQGNISEFQAQQAEIYYKQTLPKVLQIRREYESVLNELKFLADLEETNDFAIEGKIEIDENELGTQADYEPILSDNSQLRMLSKRNEIAAQQVRAQKAVFLPKVNLRLGYGFDSYNDNLSFDNHNNSVYGAVLLSIPILTGGDNKANLQKARIENENTALEYDLKRKELYKELQRSEENLKVTIQNIKNESEIISLSERELEIAKEKIQLGMITNLEAKEIRVSLTRSRLLRLNAFLDYRVEKITIQKILGNL